MNLKNNNFKIASIWKILLDVRGSASLGCLDAKVAVLEPMLLSENFCLLVFNSDIQFLKSVLIQGRIDLSLGEAPVEYYNRQ